MSAAQKVQQHPLVIHAHSKASYYISQLDKELSKYPVLNTFEQRTQVPKSYLALGALLIVTFFHFFNPSAAPVSNLIGWALPAFLSFKAIERSSAQDDVQWLTYWVIFGFFNFAESMSLGLILYYLPWYFALKSILLVWLQLPNVRGAQVLYGRFFQPLWVNITGSSRAVAHTDTVTAEGLRDRVNTAVSE